MQQNVFKCFMIPLLDLAIHTDLFTLISETVVAYRKIITRTDRNRLLCNRLFVDVQIDQG